jgi:hypothetical protein
MLMSSPLVQESVRRLDVAARATQSLDQPSSQKSSVHALYRPVAEGVVPSGTDQIMKAAVGEMGAFRASREAAGVAEMPVD